MTNRLKTKPRRDCTRKVLMGHHTNERRDKWSDQWKVRDRWNKIQMEGIKESPAAAIFSYWMSYSTIILASTQTGSL